MNMKVEVIYGAAKMEPIPTQVRGNTIITPYSQITLPDDFGVEEAINILRCYNHEIVEAT